MSASGSSSQNRHKQTQQFQTLFSQLNEEQRKAVDLIEGPVMVFAGPGTGKTQVLAMRIANILLKTDVAPHNILALTYTDTAAKAMRDRLISVIGEDAYYVNISTFHAFCSDVIQSNPEHFPLAKDAQALSDVERFSLVDGIIRGQSFEIIKPPNDPSYYVRSCIRTIQDLKREGVTPDCYRKLIEEEAKSLEEEELTAAEKKKAERNISKNHEVLQVYVLYEQALKERARYDYEDMISFTLHAFEHDPILLQGYQERLQYFLVDEYQDANTAQNRVLDALAEFWGDDANVFVVGDGDQSLYRFQGASIENSLSFLKRYKKASLITLRKNYRSSQLILDAASSLISRNTYTNDSVLAVVQKKKKKTVSQKLEATQGFDNLPVRVAAFSSDPMEVAFLVEDVRRLIDRGVEPSEIAILYRNNADSAAFEDALAKWGIKYEIDAGTNILDTSIIQQLLTLFETIFRLRTTQEDLDMFTLMNYAWSGLDALDVLKVSRHAALKKKSIFHVLIEEDLAELKLKDEKRLKQFVRNLMEWSQKDAQETFPQWFEAVINESGFLPWLLSRKESVEDLNRLQSLFSEIKKMAQANRKMNLDAFLESLRIMQQHRIAITEEDVKTSRNAVRLTTAHKAKGLEWEHVYIVRALDGKWGNVRNRELIKIPEGILQFVATEDKEKNEDERRIFYVALTRAKKQVTVTYARTTISGNRSRENTRAMFIEELPEISRSNYETAPFEQDALPLLERLLRKPPTETPNVEEKDWLAGLVSSYVLTPTALNTYLLCAYKFKLNELIRVPRAKQDFFAFGTAVHRALELLFRKILETDHVPSKEYVIAEFEKALKKEVLTEEQEKLRVDQGRKVLSAYYDVYREEFRKPLFLETFFGYGRGHIYVDDVRIAGRVDRIEWIDAKTKTVQVVDYKTGKPKSRNEIEGKTANSDGAYKRQLVFYKLLADLDRTFGLKVERGVLDFVEPESGTKKFRQESFTLTKDDVAALKETIKQVMAEIRALHFPRTTNYSVCERCEFKKHCWPEGIPQQTPEQMKLL